MKKILSCNVDEDIFVALGKLVMTLGYVYGGKNDKSEPKPHWGKFFTAIVKGEIILSKKIDLP